MTHQKILETLDELMPEIASTKNPEGVLLKFAKTNNLYPTQVQKLGHAFNQCKTLVGLQKQANRGDSFSLLDVPKMLEKYSTYTPSDVLTSKEKKVHNKVNKITKSASEQDMPFERLPMPDFLEQLKYKGAEIDTNNTAEYDLSKSSGNFDITFSKSASENMQDPIYVLKEAAESLKEAIHNAGVITSTIEQSIAEKCASIVSVLRHKGPQAWSDIVEDSVYRFGAEKVASTIDTIENYLEVNRIPYTTVDLTKKAYSNNLVKDRHNVFGVISDITELVSMHKEASGEKCSLNAELLQIRNSIKNILTKEAANHTPSGSALNPPPPPLPTLEVYAQTPDKAVVNSNDMKGLLSVAPPVLNSTVQVVGGAKQVLVDQPMKAIDDFEHYSGKIKRLLPTSNQYQKKFDKEEAKLDKEMAMQKLILSDPILAEADPNEVQEIYETIASISPRFASNPRLMSTALKEAIQYGAVPVSMIKDIADFEDKYTKARNSEEAYKASLYRL